jgi:hypothetical protein
VPVNAGAPEAPGGRVAVVETNLGRPQARAAYQAAGFAQAHVIYRREAWAIDVS